MGVSWIKREFTDVGLTQYPVAQVLRALQGRLGDSGNPAVLDAPTPELPAGTGVDTGGREHAGAREAGPAVPRPADGSAIRARTGAPVPDDERAVLMALFESTDGPNWTYHPRGAWTSSWDSDEPVGLWYGITTNRTGHVTHIVLPDMDGLQGPIPPDLGQLANLQTLDLRYYHLSGPIPPDLGQLTNLEFLYLRGNNLSGRIPPQLWHFRRSSSAFFTADYSKVAW